MDHKTLFPATGDGVFISDIHMKPPEICVGCRFWQVVLNRRFDIEGLILEHIINSAGVRESQ